MKDVQRLLIYGIGTFVIILLLIQVASMEMLPDSVLVIASILAVVVLPIVISIKMVNKEKSKQKSNVQ